MNTDPYIAKWTNLLGDFVGYRLRVSSPAGYWDAIGPTYKSHVEAEAALENLKKEES